LKLEIIKINNVLLESKLYPRMPVRGLNNTIQVNSSIYKSLSNRTTNALVIYLNNTNYHNMTSEEINMALGDPTANYLPELTTNQLINIASFVIPFILIGIIAIQVGTYLHHKIKKDKMTILTPINWIKNKYYSYNNKELLPTVRPKKAKESPFISALPTPPVLPLCPRLEGAEKGQNNLQVRFSIPYRRFQSTDNLPAEEHRITITTIVDSTHPPKI
jgi:hypothetical protein